MDRGCGLLRMARVRSEISLFYRPACNSKNCPWCREKVLNRWMERIPEGTVLYADVIHKSQWKGLKDQLARSRQRGDDGDYAHVPVSDTTYLVVSDAPIGEPIDHSEIRDALDYTETEYGRLITSRNWKKPAAPVKADEGSFRDEGVCRSSWKWINGKLEQRGHEKVHHEERKRGYRTTEDEHQSLIDVAAPVSEAEYWAQRKSGLTDAEWTDVEHTA